MVSGPLGLRTAHGLRTTRSPDRSWSPDYMVSGSCRFGQSRSLPFPDHRPRSAGWAWARMPRHARTACICKDTHCLALGFHGGSTHLLLQAHPCPGSSATFSNPGKKNCGRFGLALFFWVVLFGFKLGAVQHALTHVFQRDIADSNRRQHSFSEPARHYSSVSKQTRQANKKARRQADKPASVQGRQKEQTTANQPTNKQAKIC